MVKGSGHLYNVSELVGENVLGYTIYILEVIFRLFDCVSVKALGKVFKLRVYGFGFWV